MAPFNGWGSTVSGLQSHYEETVYILPLVPRNSWYSFDQPWKDERLSRPWSHLVAFFLKNFIAPFCGWGSTASRLQRHYEETVYFLPLVPRNFWYSFDRSRKDERLSRLWSQLVDLNTEPLD